MLYDERDPKTVEGYPFFIPSNSSLKIPFPEKTKKQARQHLEWFLELLPNRISDLKDMISQTDPSLLDKLDYSPQSLIFIFEWFLNRAVIMKRSREDIKSQKESLPDFLKGQPGNITTHTLSPESLSLLYSIGVYMGECFVKHDQRLKWGIGPGTKVVGANEPVILGFKKNIPFIPFWLMETIAVKVSENRGIVTGLYDLFHSKLKELP